MDNYCTSCGRCQNCGANRGASPTMIFPNVAGAAAPAPLPVVVNTVAAGGAESWKPGCEHMQIVWR